ncbi:hypothetical protein RchiOBHm_Chr4g0386331 [Rosa chinensis]|uniref:Uncharacterized protein n=1 Tax=Rosa chinensis TaxID=74649 RepID=A0A2P6QP54_ROSCH|nr:hypothetical protein RchiOBHm_Chr4g0386331 [Rosa chinensis]
MMSPWRCDWFVGGLSAPLVWMKLGLQPLRQAQRRRVFQRQTTPQSLFLLPHPGNNREDLLLQ